MQILRKEFHHPAGEFRTAEKIHWFFGVYTDKEWHPYEYSKILEDVTNFVNAIGEDRIISICEFETPKTKSFFFDDKYGANHSFVIWYLA